MVSLRLSASADTPCACPSWLPCSWAFALTPVTLGEARLRRSPGRHATAWAALPSCAPVSASRLPLSEPRAAVDNHLLALTGLRIFPALAVYFSHFSAARTGRLRGFRARPRERLLRRHGLLRALGLRPDASTTGIGSSGRLATALWSLRRRALRAHLPARISLFLAYVAFKAQDRHRLALSSSPGPGTSSGCRRGFPTPSNVLALRAELVHQRRAVPVRIVPRPDPRPSPARERPPARDRRRASRSSRCSPSPRGFSSTRPASLRSTDPASAHRWLYRTPVTRLGDFLPRHLRRAPLRRTCAGDRTCRARGCVARRSPARSRSLFSHHAVLDVPLRVLLGRRFCRPGAAADPRAGALPASPAFAILRAAGTRAARRGLLCLLPHPRQRGRMRSARRRLARRHDLRRRSASRR